MSPARLPRFRRAAVPPPLQLTDRDERILETVAAFRFVTCAQLHQLIFTDRHLSACKRRLTKLFHNGYLTRRYLPMTAPYGANQAVYCLDRAGYELLAFKMKYAPPSWRPRDNDQGLHFLEHLVATNDARVALTMAAAAEGFALNWTDERTLRASIGRPVSATGSDLPRAIPDGVFTLDGPGFEQAFAVELDRGTEAERPFRRKIRVLISYWQSGQYKHELGDRPLRVLVITAPSRDRRRLERLKDWTEKEGGGGLFWFAPLPLLTAGSAFWAPIWQVGRRAGTFPLFREG